MTSDRWVAIDVDYFRNPKVRAAGATGRTLHLASICYAGARRTDGHISSDDLGYVLLDAQAPRRAVEAVIAAGLWVPNGDGWNVHDFLVWQESKQEGLAAIERARAGGRARAKRWREAHGDS